MALKWAILQLVTTTADLAVLVTVALSSKLSHASDKEDVHEYIHQ